VPPASLSEQTGAETPAFDPLYQGVHLPLEGTYHPLGFPLKLATNSADVLLAAEEAWAGFPHAYPTPPLYLRIAVDNADPAPCPEGLKFRAQRHLLAIISDDSTFAVCDLANGFTFCWASAATARNRDWFRYFYLDTMSYHMLWRLYLTRVHASCVARDGWGVLLCGPSGAGKSCLAYACARRGWTFVSDEATSLLRNSPERIVLGKPQAIRLRDTATGILPELDGNLAARNLAGKMTIEVPTAGLAGVSTDFRCRAGAVVFLNRSAGGPPRLVPLSKDEAWRRFEQDLPLFEPPVHEEHKASIRKLLEVNVLELCSYDLDFGVKALDELAQGGGVP
jgi:hypothetical protein